MDDFEKEYPEFDWKNTPAYKHPRGKDKQRQKDKQRKTWKQKLHN